MALAGDRLSTGIMTIQVRQASDLDRRLFAVSRPPGAGADLFASRESGLVMIEPLSLAGTRWLHQAASAEASWLGDSLIVELRYFPEFADAAIAAGLTFERDALTN